MTTSGGDTSDTRYTDADTDVAGVGARSLQDGDPSQAEGSAVDDLDDVDQVAALLPGPGLSFRGGGADWWEEGATYDEPGWLRTSRDPNVATDNFAGGDVVAVFGATGRDVASLTGHPEEQETVFLPGRRFTVLRRGDLDGWRLTVVRVHPDGDDDDSEASPAEIDDAVTRAATALTRARTLPPEPIARPGRFSGEFGTRR